MDSDTLQKLIDKAIKQDRFLLYFQPIFDTEKNRYSKAEVLLRMLDDDGNIVMPGQFIPVAENNGQIIEIGYIVIEKLCQRISAFDSLSQILFSVNISPLQLRQSDFYEKVKAIFSKYEVAHERIVLEITESVSYGYCSTVKDNINNLHSDGFALSLDDLGQGSSDLLKVFLLPIDYLKIDKRYIDAICTDQSIQTLIKRIIRFSFKQKITIVAEGVETLGQFNILKEYKCPLIQGFFFSKPLCENDFCSVLQSGLQPLGN